MLGKKRLLFDIETDNLLDACTRIHCAVTFNLDTKEIREFTPENIHQLPEELGTAEELWGHNLISFDLPAIKKIYPEEYRKYLSQFEGTEGERVFDTMVLSRLVWPDIKSMDFENIAKGSIELPPEAGAKKALIGAHSLKAWGYRLGYYKGRFKDEVGFETYTPEMLEYNKRDVLLNVRLLELIEKKAPNAFSVHLEHQFYRYLEYQQNFGVAFDSEFAEFLCGHWERELEKRVGEMKALVPDILKETTIIPKVNNSRHGYVKGVPFTKKKIIPFNPRSGPHIISFLTHKYGWVPTEFTKKKQPAVTYEILKALPYKEAPLLARIKLLMDRIGLVKTEKKAWLKCVKGGRVYGGIIHNGTPTARCRHLSPNLGNIPSETALWGKTLRKLFRASEGFKLVGVDFDSLEMRCLAEVLWDYDGGAFFEMAFSGKKEDGTDAHSLNAKAIREALKRGGFPGVAEKMTRAKAKTAFYAFIYGAWPRKLGAVACEGLSEIPAQKHPRVGQCVQEGLVNNIRGLGEVTEILKSEYKKCLAERRWPHIKGLDGRLIPIRKESALLNSLLQSMGAILCKLACVLLLQRVEELPCTLGLPGGRWRPVLHVHDEIQCEVTDADNGEVATTFANLVTECFRETGEYFKFRVPILGTASIGNNWSETH